jgi:heme/copper-type cytochrome/quinol oxidase subunit 4
MATFFYNMCALVSLICSVLLLRAYARSRLRLLLWSAICFIGLAISNLLIFIDLNMLPQVDLYVIRLVTAAIAVMILLYGLIWEGDR